MARAEDTHDRLQHHALALFAEHGFDGTTVEQIAAAAGVSHMTFFRHFATKESVVFEDPYDPLIAAMVAATDRALPPVERVRRGLLEAWSQMPEVVNESTRLRIRLAGAHDGLRAHIWQQNQVTMDAVVEVLVADGVDQRQAVVAAGACMGALTAALLDWGARASDTSGLGPTIVEALGQLAVTTLAEASR